MKKFTNIKANKNLDDLEKKPNWFVRKFSNKKFMLRMICIGMAVQFAIIAVLLVAFVQMKSSMDVLSNSIAYLTDNTDVIVSNMDSLQEDIEQTLEEENSLLESWAISMTDLDFASNTYQVHISIVPKNYTETMLAYIYFGVSEFELERDGYKYIGDANLPIDESYEGNVTILFVDGEQRSTEVLSNYDGIVNDFTDVLSGTLANMPEYSDGELKVNAECEYDLDGGDNFMFNEFELVVLANGKELGAYDLMHESETNLLEEGNINDKLDSDSTTNNDLDESDEELTGANSDSDSSLNSGDGTNSSDGIKASNSSATSNDSTLSDGTDASDNSSTDDLGTDSILDAGSDNTDVSKVTPISRISGRYNSNESYQVSDGANVRILLKATTTEGYSFVYDLFNGKIPSEQELESDNPELVKGFKEVEDFFKIYSYVYDAKGGKYTICN